MGTTGSGRDLSALLDAYALLEVPLTASPGDVRRSYRALAHTHHPDKYPAGSAEQQAATSRMVLLNRAYGLIQDAPLRYHPISRGPDAVFDDSQAVVDAAIDRARRGRPYRDMAVGIAFGTMAVVGVAILFLALQRIGVSQAMSLLLAGVFIALAFTMRRSVDPLLAADALHSVLRFIAR